MDEASITSNPINSGVEPTQDFSVPEKKRGPKGPSKYSEEIIQKTQEYIDSCEDEEIQQVKISSEKGYENYIYKVKVNLPTVEGLAGYLKVNRDTIYDWCKEYKEFSDIIEELKAKQAERLINNGLSGDYNSTIAKVLLTKHGYVDKNETDLTSGGKPLPIYGGISRHPSDKEDIQPKEEN